MIDNTKKPTAPRTEQALVKEFSHLAKAIYIGYRRKLPKNVDSDDIYAAALIGLWDAARKHGDLPRSEFVLYAKKRIRGSICDELRRQNWMPRRHHQKPENERIKVVSFEDGFENGRAESLPSDATAVDELLGTYRQERELHAAVGRLESRDRDIVSMLHFGEMKMIDVGKVFGVTEPRISQIHSRALKRLRKELYRSRLTELSPEFVRLGESCEATDFSVVRDLPNADGLKFNCPSGSCDAMFVWFSGNGPKSAPSHVVSGTRVTDLTVQPELRHWCGWRGTVINGEVREI